MINKEFLNDNMHRILHFTNTDTIAHFCRINTEKFILMINLSLK